MLQTASATLTVAVTSSYDLTLVAYNTLVTFIVHMPLYITFYYSLSVQLDGAQI